MYKMPKGKRAACSYKQQQARRHINWTVINNTEVDTYV